MLISPYSPSDYYLSQPSITQSLLQLPRRPPSLTPWPVLAWSTLCPGAAVMVSSQAAAAPGPSGPMTSSQPGSGAAAGTTSSMDTSELDGDRNAKYSHSITTLDLLKTSLISARENPMRFLGLLTTLDR